MGAALSICSKPPRHPVKVMPLIGTMEADILQTQFEPPIKHVNPNNPWLPLLTPHQLVEINGAFKKFDRDGDGHIEPKEIQTVMANLGIPMTKEQVQKLIAGVDVDGNGMIEFDEFIGIMAERMLKNESDESAEINQAFRLFDDGSGYLHVDEIRQKLTEMGSLRLSNAEVDALLVHVGPADAQGRISFNQFTGSECWNPPVPAMVASASRKREESRVSRNAAAAAATGPAEAGEQQQAAQAAGAASG